MILSLQCIIFLSLQYLICSQNANIYYNVTLLKLKNENCDLDANNYVFEIECNIDTGKSPVVADAQILTAEKEAYNSFENKENVITKPYSQYRIENNKIILDIPPVSVISFKIK